MRTANIVKTWVAAVGCLLVGCTSAPESEEEPIVTSEEVKIVPVRGGWLVPTHDTNGEKLFVAVAKEDVQVGKASLEGATLPNLGVGKNPFGHPEGYYRIQHHSRLPLADDQRVRIFVAHGRDMEDAMMFTVTPDLTTTQSGGFFAEGGLEMATNASHQLGVGLGTDPVKKAELLARVQERYNLIASAEGLPQTRLHYELDIGILARMGFNADDMLTETLNRNQPILVADRIRSILGAEMVESEDPDLTTGKPCNGTVPGEETPDPTEDETEPTDEPTCPVLL